MGLRMSCQQIDFAYEKRSIFREISLEILPGQLYSIVGPNGAGKSTLLKCLSNIYHPKVGMIYLDDRLLTEIDQRNLARILGYVPQKEAASFTISVYEMILLGRRPYINWRVKREDEEIVESILSRLGITHLAERQVDTLSGGERQKVAIARALAQCPEIIFLDEPTANLDMNHQLEVMEILVELAQADKTAVVVVIHDLNLANRYSDKIFLLGREKVYAAGVPEDVLTKENIREVYGVDVDMIDTPHGRYIIPMKK